MNVPAAEPRAASSTASTVDRVADVVSALCVLAICGLDAAQRWLVPIGGLLALPVLAWLAWHAVRGLAVRDVLVTLAVGLSGGTLLVAVQWQLRRIPFLTACIACLSQYVGYSIALTFLQGFGWTATCRLAIRCLRRRAAR